MPKIFISYRREDSKWAVKPIYDRLREEFGPDQVFKDVDSIPLGAEFREAIAAAVGECDILLVVIGAQWRRLLEERLGTDQHDYVRAEIEAGFNRKLRVIPVLLDNMVMPAGKDLPESLRSLTSRNAISIRPDPEFDDGVTRLIRGLKQSPIRPQPGIPQLIVEPVPEPQTGARQSLSEPSAPAAGAAGRSKTGRLTGRYGLWLAVLLGIAGIGGAIAVVGNGWRNWNWFMGTKNIAPNTEGSEASEESDPMDGNAPGEEREFSELKIKFSWCPPGEFKFGSSEWQVSSERLFAKSGPVEVTLTEGFWLAQHEITQEHYERVMGNNPSWFSTAGAGRSDVTGEQTAQFPVERLSWDEAMDFCGKLTENERKERHLPLEWKYTLPTEAQWEYACRAGSTTRFCFGDDQARLSEFAWYSSNSENKTHLVGTRAANAWGLHDMHGNVWEWCRDVHVESLLGGRDPEVTHGSSGRVTRGGCWDMIAPGCQSANRKKDSADARDYNLGFRIALSQVR